MPRSFSRMATLSPRVVTRCQNSAGTVSKPSSWMGCVICTFMCRYPLRLAPRDPLPPCGGGVGRGGILEHLLQGFPPPLTPPHVVSKTRLRHDGEGDIVAFDAMLEPSSPPTLGALPAL